MSNNIFKNGMYWSIFKLLCVIYANGVRTMIKEAIDDPETDWDDTALTILDRVFNYSQ
jgi:hypothetical protein